MCQQKTEILVFKNDSGGLHIEHFKDSLTPKNIRFEVPGSDKVQLWDEEPLHTANKSPTWEWEIKFKEETKVLGNYIHPYPKNRKTHVFLWMNG